MTRDHETSKSSDQNNSQLPDPTYKERLNKLVLPYLEEKRVRGDMIAVFMTKMGTDKIDRDDLLARDRERTSDHGKKPRRQGI